MNDTQAMNTDFIESVIEIAKEVFSNCQLNDHKIYKLKVKERCLYTQDLPLIFDFAEMKFGSATISIHEEFHSRVIALWTEFSPPEDPAVVAQAEQQPVQPISQNENAIITEDNNPQQQQANNTVESKRRKEDMKRCFTDGQQIRHHINKKGDWVGIYNYSKNVIECNGKEYKSLSHFAKEHNKLEKSYRKSNTSNGWKECECYVDGTWKRCRDIPLP